MPAADAILVDQPKPGKHQPVGKVRLLGDKWKTGSRILLAGCDPGGSILAQSLAEQSYELVACYENRSRAFGLLHDGLVHVAGSHLLDKSTGKPDPAPLMKMFPRSPVAVFSYAMWEEG